MLDVFLQPGEYYFGRGDTRVRTLLGSCVAVTLWHPRLRIGGMTHSLLPGGSDGAGPGLDGRFIDESVLWLLREAVRAGTDPGHYVVKLFGGSDMFTMPTRLQRLRVGSANAAMAVRVLEGVGLSVAVCDLGGSSCRTIVFELETGDVWVRYGQSSSSEAQSVSVVS